MVPEERLELSRLAALASKTRVSTNSTIPAGIVIGEAPIMVLIKLGVRITTNNS
ncbi:MAG: hypothetical protein ACD_2C00168G0001 [uncultured bacterium (gcode 4)]|uniref:Uncharacterized protein n=1 Tax=uncultured bacterium (gcode 4) TaxID=1234023 RepID=K2FE83_9BACT|nr:MAG: hypothetical protein ACD_2C00168G0001 [uncultured bacterium (gcode 4)]